MPANVWLGVSVEDRKYGVPRIQQLRKVRSAVRFLSVEPLLEDLGPLDLSGVHWVIVGGESGPGARTMKLAWAQGVLDQCRAAGVRAFMKQLGAKPVDAAGERHAITDRKGALMAEWPRALRIRQMPLPA